MQRGWKPWGIKHFVEVLVSWTTATFFTEKSVASHASLRSLVSLESGLWKIVCDEQLCRLPEYIDAQWHKTIEDDRDNERDLAHILTEYDYRYWIVESALIPEKELGKFLVDNIKVE